MRLFIKIALAVLLVAGHCEAQAMTTLKQVQVSNSSQVDLLFDGKVNKSQLQTEFFNDIIQISMIDVTVYPAKISSVNGGDLRKVFAYQYAPRLVRCRLTVSGKAENYKDRLQVNTNGKMLTIRVADSSSAPAPVAAPASSSAPSMGANTHAIKEGSGGERTDQISVQGAAPVRSAPDSVEEKPSAKPASVEEKELLDHVLTAPLHKAGETAKKAEVPAKKEKKLEGKKPSALPSVRGVLMKLALVLGIFGVFAIFLKKVTGARGNRLAGKGPAGMLGGQWSSLGGTLGRFAKSGLGKLGHKEKMIDVLSTHHLGPKQSIAVVKVCGQKMVLGIANDSISLISQLSGEEFELDGSEAEALTGSVADFLRSGASAGTAKPAPAKPPVQNPGNFAAYLSDSQQSLNHLSMNNSGEKPQFAGQYSGRANEDVSASVRARIRSRLEGLKQL